MKQGFDFIGNSVVYFCHDGKGNVVMAKRSQNARDEKGRWDIGGGALELYETVDQALRKEIKEEYNCEVISFDFKVLVDVSDLKTNEPHKFDEVKLFPISEMIREPEQVHSQLPEFLEKYKDRL